MNNKDAILLSLLVGIKENFNLTELEKNVIIDGLNLLHSEYISTNDLENWESKCYDADFCIKPMNEIVKVHVLK